MLTFHALPFIYSINKLQHIYHVSEKENSILNYVYQFIVFFSSSLKKITVFIFYKFFVSVKFGALKYLCSIYMLLFKDVECLHLKIRKLLRCFVSIMEII